MIDIAMIGIKRLIVTPLVLMIEIRKTKVVKPVNRLKKTFVNLEF